MKPNDEILNQLQDEAIKSMEYKRNKFDDLFNQIDWLLATAKQLDRAISITLSFGKNKYLKHVTELGLKKFPDYEGFQNVWRGVFNPRPARVVKSEAA